MSKKAPKKSSVVRPSKSSKSTKRIKRLSLKSSPWYAFAAQSIGVSNAPR
jgi:hypothetical protein